MNFQKYNSFYIFTLLKEILYIFYNRKVYYNLKNLEVVKMEEYKVENINLRMGPKNNAEKFERKLNELAAQGWEFKFNSGFMWLLKREK